MDSLDNTNAIPPQEKGSKMDAVAERDFASETEAQELFQLACNRMLNINQWGELVGLSSFQLMDQKGNRLDRRAEQGDYVRIDIPGPGTMAGKGYDWVHIEEIYQGENHTDQFLAIKVRPCEYPLSNENATAHFLKGDATSTFIIRKVANKVYAEEHGRNEMPNTADVGFIDSGRNFLVGFAAKLGLAYPQWKALVKALIK